MRQIALTNISTVVTDADVKAAMVAMQRQISRDYFPIWGEDADLFFLPKDQKISSGVSQMVIADDSDQAGALGYHELTANGDPIGYTFAKTDKDNGYNWCITLSHELVELMADPAINEVAEVDNPDGSIVFYAWEIADACEDDQYGYVVLDGNMAPLTLPDGTPIVASDFVTPHYFESPAPPNVAFDVRGHIIASLQVLTGGYMSLLKVPGTAGWEQVTAQSNLKGAQLIPGGKEIHAGSRRARRRIADSTWKRSTQ
jgi:hypothetical protein